VINESFQRRFKELEAKFGTLQFQPNHDTSGTHVPEGYWQQWATSAQNLILAVFGEGSPHYTNFIAAFKNCFGYEEQVDVLKGIFLSAKDDFEGGYVFNVELRVSGEVFGDFVALARQSLSEGYKDVAAVLACAALEDALKRYAAVNGLDVSDKTMQDVVNALKSRGFVAGAQKSLLDAIPRIRNLAMHAEWEKLSAPDVSSVIGFVEQFLLSKFSHG
jgi:uncharacterized protein DUF4145